MSRRREGGQILVLFAGGLIGLLALAALAIDISSVYSTQQTEKAAADAASLAGAQDLQVKGSRLVGDRATARAHALADVAGRFGVGVPDPLVVPACATTTDITDCPLAGTPYHVSISTPAKTTSDEKSLQVSVFNPDYRLSFANLFGQHGWNVGKTSIAVIDNAKSYALETLRPPASGSTSDVKDIAINGGTHVVIGRGDVGSNANMMYDGSASCDPSGSRLFLDPGYGMYFADPYNPQEWCAGAPTGKPLDAYIQDPKYVIPDETLTTPVGAPVADTNPACVAAANALWADAFYKSKLFPAGWTSLDYSKIECYSKGKYTFDPSVNNNHIAILLPGLYFFDDGLTVQGNLVGGFTPGGEGVALVFSESNNGFKDNTSGSTILINAGGRMSSPAGAAATATNDYGTPPKPVTTNTTPPVPLTIMVRPDLNCESPTREIVLPIPAACAMPEVQRSTVFLSGNANLYLGGVQYGPTDNMTLNSSSTVGYVGQIVAWTVKYSGGTTINQEGLAVPLNGILRLDKACSGGSTPCTP